MDGLTLKSAKRGIRSRWVRNALLPVTVLLLFGLVIGCFSISNYYRSAMLTRVKTNAETTSDFFNRYLVSASDFYTAARSFTNEFADKDVIEMQTVSVVGDIIYSSSGLATGFAPGTPDTEECAVRRKLCDYTGKDTITGERVISVSTPLYNSEGKLTGFFRFVTSMERADKTITTFSLLFLLAAAIIFLLIILTNVYFIRTIVTPVRRINETARKIAAGKYGEQIQDTYNDEIGELAETINFMSVEIGRSEQVKNDFISSVSHELRTPLTAINGWAETLSDNMESPAILKRGLTVITKEAANLKAMLDELLDFSRMQSGRLVVHFGQVNVGDEVEDVIFSFSETLKQDDFAVNFENKLGDTWISADRARLRQVFVVLIDNARKHSHEGKYLDITLEESFFREGDPCVMLTFRDHGAGIPEDELPHVTEKFYKGSSKRPGSGIGLAVAKEIITLHDGSLLIRNAEEGTGTVITIKLPYQHETTPSETEDTTHA